MKTKIPPDGRPPARTEELFVKSYEVDSSGKLKLYALMNFFQEIAGHHATQLGWGYEELRARGLFWVLSRIKIFIGRVPHWGEAVFLTTWPVGVDKLFAIRDFRMEDKSQNRILSAVSAWLLLDREGKRPQKIGTIPEPIFQRGVEGNIHPTPGKLLRPANLEVRYEKIVVPSDLDVNRHVNNAEYMKWITDALAVDKQGEAIQTIQVNYLEEALEGDTIAVFQAPSEEHNGLLYLEGISRSSGSRVFQAEVLSA